MKLSRSILSLRRDTGPGRKKQDRNRFDRSKKPHARVPEARGI